MRIAHSSSVNSVRTTGSDCGRGRLSISEPKNENETHHSDCHSGIDNETAVPIDGWQSQDANGHKYRSKFCDCVH